MERIATGYVKTTTLLILWGLWVVCVTTRSLFIENAMLVLGAAYVAYEICDYINHKSKKRNIEGTYKN